MTAISIANIKKTYDYLRRNGLRNTWDAVRERLEEGRQEPYIFQPVPEEELEEQRRVSRQLWEKGECAAAFSIVVPAYRTDPRYLREMIDSVRRQSYPVWELILADATEDDSVAGVAMEYEGAETAEIIAAGGEAPAPAPGKFRPGRILCLRLSGNGGISENTNAALPYVRGNYVGLLDHDDILVENALYEMAGRIRTEKKRGIEVKMLYSDEDKCSSDRNRYFEPNKKEGFNLDLILSNNYICHFLVMKSGMIQKLGLRKAYDGAQDYDLILRAANSLELMWKPQNEEKIVHVPKVLYHWRCHEGSTAENPRSKEYAYEAGRRALQDYADRNRLDAEAVLLRHRGFYQLLYRNGVFADRRDVGAVGGPVLSGGRIAGGRMDGEGNVFYEGLPFAYSGYLHRAVLTQDAEAVDIRRIAVRGELHGLFEQIVGIPYQTSAEGEIFDASLLPKDCDHQRLSLELCRAIRERGYRLLWLRSIPQRPSGENVT